MATLDQRLLEAHARDDRAMLVELYSEAAENAGSIDAKCFYLTHAYIYAIERGDPAQSDLYAALKAHDRIG